MLRINPLLPYTAVTEILSFVYNYYLFLVCRFVLINALGFVRWYSILVGKIGVSQQESKQRNVLQNYTPANWMARLLLFYRWPKWGGLEGVGEDKTGANLATIHQRDGQKIMITMGRGTAPIYKNLDSRVTHIRPEIAIFMYQQTSQSRYFWSSILRMQLLLTGKRTSDHPLRLPTVFGNNLRVNNAYRYQSSSKFDRHIHKLSPQPVHLSSVSHCDFPVASKATPWKQM